MVGAGISAWVAGYLRDTTGTYDLAWWSAGVLCLLAAVASYAVPRGDQLAGRTPDPDPELTPADA
jgi:cyanate permease